MLGHPAMASMGRMRRRMAVCSLLQLVNAQLCPVLLELKHVAQIMTVAICALKETPQFEVRAVIALEHMCNCFLAWAEHPLCGSSLFSDFFPTQCLTYIQDSDRM